MTKQRSLDVDKVTSALKRAAAAATSGARDARSGKFVADSAAKRPPASATVEAGKNKK